MAITSTQENYNLHNSGQLLSYIERNLVNFMAHSEYYMFETDPNRTELKESAFAKEYMLKKYHEDFIEGFERIQLYTAILFNLTNWSGLDGDNEKALMHIEASLKTCKICNSLQYFCTQIYNKSFAYISMGKADEGLKFLFDFVVIAKSSDDMLENVDFYLDDIKTYLNYDIPKQFFKAIDKIK